MPISYALIHDLLPDLLPYFSSCSESFDLLVGNLFVMVFVRASWSAQPVNSFCFVPITPLTTALDLADIPC
jgi:hypothetical protein